MSVVLSHPGAAMQEKIDVLPHEFIAPPNSSSRKATSSSSKTVSSYDPQQDPSEDQHQYVRDYVHFATSDATSNNYASSNTSSSSSKDIEPTLEDDENNENNQTDENDANNNQLPEAPMSVGNATSESEEDNENDDSATIEAKKESAQVPVVSLAGRFSESAVPEKLDPEFVLPIRPNDYKSTRSSLVSFEPSAKVNDGGNPFNNNNNNNNNISTNFRRGSNFVDFSMRDSCTSDASGFEAFQYLNVDDGELSLSSSAVTPRSMMRTNPYEGISIEVNNHSINNQGVVMYHVDIKGPEGLLSTYTIRRRYKAFKELHQELNRLISEYVANQSKGSAQTANSDSVTDAFSAANVPDSPHTQARNNQKLQQIAEGSVLNASFTFPALPNGGVWSYLKRHDVRLVEQRKKRFEEILRIAIRHPATRTSAMLDSFLSVAPSLISERGSSYVSLQDYSVPVFDRQRESIERKQLKLRRIEGRRQRTSSEASSSQS